MSVRLQSQFIHFKSQHRNFICELMIVQCSMFKLKLTTIYQDTMVLESRVKLKFWWAKPRSKIGQMNIFYI